jgi:hypothetical protein
MTTFDKKEWLDKHVVPLLAGPPSLTIYHPFWNGIPPKDVMVVLMAGEVLAAKCSKCHTPRKDAPTKGLDCAQTGCTYESSFEPTAWPAAIKRLLDDHKFRFDFTRDHQAIPFDGGMFNAFGGDGSPVYDKTGLARCRLFRKAEDGIPLIVEVSCKYRPTDELGAGEHAAAATKAFYGLFEESPLEICQKYGAIFGQA